MKTLIATLAIIASGLTGLVVSDNAEAYSGTSNTIGDYTYHNWNNKVVTIKRGVVCNELPIFF